MADKCPHCGYQNESGADYCHFCNATLERPKKSAHEGKVEDRQEAPVFHPPKYCSSCGAPVVHGSAACPNCGTPTGHPKVEEKTVEPKESLQEPPSRTGRYCESCRVWWPDSVAYCQKCGEVIDPELRLKVNPTDPHAIVICPNCGTRNARRERYCCTCAANLESVKN